MLQRFLTSLSAIGLILGTIFFAASLTPSLIPRTFLMQGALSGACFAIGYGIGVAWRWLWRYMGLPVPRGLRTARIAAAGICVAGALWFLWRTNAWQNSIRELMGLEPLPRLNGFAICLIAVVTFLVLMLLARLFGMVVRKSSGIANRYVPTRVSQVIGIAVGLVLFWTIANGVLARFALQVLDSSYAELDALFEPERERPTEPFMTGSSASVLAWEDLGRAGRQFVASAPTSVEIEALTEKPALAPIRVYAGLRSADSVGERARLALEELKRAGGFDRSVLIIVTPTGTGWVDSAAMDPVEYLHNGDVASVALQYSYLSSPLSLLVQPDYGAEAARALFSSVYGYWTTLPKDHRPKLYLFGLSLGAMNSERSANLFEILNDPIQGAVWSGPPFESRIWRQITDTRNPDSPEWLPQFRDGSLFRFMNQNGPTVPDGTPWGPMRIVYLQYASDAITFFRYRDAYRSPDWMNAPRGPDVSPYLRWFPVVTMLQLAVDMAVANTAPMGYGHLYAPEHYTEAWLAVTEPQGWTAERIEKLKIYLHDRIRQ